MNAEQVMEEIEELVASFEEEKEKAERSLKDINKQIETEHNSRRLSDLFCNLYWEKSRKSTLEMVIFQLKMTLGNYHSN